MGNGMNKILPGLYLGNIQDSNDSRQLKSITHVLSIHDVRQPELRRKIHLRLHVADSVNQDIAQYFSECNNFIHSARLGGGKVLVHCIAGMSRSVTIIIAYLMTVTNLSWHESLCAVQAARSIANPNGGFQRQLVIFQHMHLDSERRRLEQRFGTSPFDDTSQAKQLLKAYHRFIVFR